ncbi:MAG: hypothetical protein NTZ63_02515 [Candidatus Omnitrophica bacterium]|nr:hypothetical protein [Candidatus Omnitrophota bacterium]
MKSVLVYYSHYGNTANVASEVQDYLRKLGTVDKLEIEYFSKNKGLLERVFYRLLPNLVNIASIKTDLKEYDLICFGIPVWGGRPSAPIIRYLKLCKNIQNKKIICFYIFGVDASAKICAEYVGKALGKKTHRTIVNVFIPWANVHDDNFIKDSFREVFKDEKTT